MFLTHLASLALLAMLATGEPQPTGDACGPSSRYVVAYYNTWKRQSLMNIDWAKITHLNVAHAIPTDTGDFTFDGEWFLPQLVRDAHGQKTKIMVSLGGWTGSNRFTPLMRDTHKRAALIRAIGVFVEKYELDGVDLDWEYVGRQGSKCNKFSASEDSANLLRFLRGLRASFHARFPDTEKIISLAVRVQPFDGPDGPLTDVSPFAEFVDYALLMAFDVNGHWSNTTGPNAPLDHQRNRGAPYSLTQSVDQWIGAKWPANKLVAGISFTGRSLTTRDVLTAKTGAQMYVPFDRDIPQGDPEDARWYDVCENTNQMSGVWQYKHLRDQGVLKTANTTGDEWVRVWDDKSSTPWLYNPQMRRFVSYDDPESVEKKVEFVRSRNLKGVMAWGLHADYNNELMSVLDRVGPLCRGAKTDSDPAPSSASSSASSSSMASSSSWSPTAPMAFLPSHATSKSAESSSLSSSSSSSSSASPSSSSSSLSSPSSSPSSLSSGTADETSEPVTKPTETPTSAQEPTQAAESTTAAAASAATSSTQASAQSAATLATKKAILFDDAGAPYMIVDGTSTAVPSEIADKLMKIGDNHTLSATDTPGTATATAGSESTSVTDDALPIGPVAIPVVDGAPSSASDKSHDGLFAAAHGTTPLWQQYNHQTNLFETKPMTAAATSTLELHGPMYVLSTTVGSSTGFAATFFLTLDPSSTGLLGGATTVVPLAQMMSSASEAANGSAASISAASASATASASLLSSLGASSIDPLASPSAASSGSSMSMSPSPFI
ncbi:hypothetical protein LPJ56_000680 [Coemansia sp. RSA 2599]|nr:hypothetical protein LPJ75_000340 [Coemansia sp. RSA 2598]KAJ1829046.1 hypothetical protein LPJ56_000680 [Coemansia sp. RSA 2599]